jgi:hypothetical protein
LFALINNTENYDKRGKQGMMKQLLFQLEHMEQNIYTTQIDIMEKTVNELQEFHNSTINLSGSLRSKLARFIDERILIETYESYERAFNNYDKINNQK